MNSKDKKLEELKKEYSNIEIPSEIDECIHKGILRGEKELTRGRKIKITWFNKINVAAAILAAFIISINTIPSFANAIYDVAGIGKLVKVLQFHQGSAEGGRITDGTDINFISLQKEKDTENIIINFAQENIPQALVNHFTVDYSQYPNTITFSIPGTRNFSAEKDFETLKQSKMIKDAYKLITLDDSMVRFAVTLAEPVILQVKEFKEPAQIVVTLKSSPNTNMQPIYSLRSASYPFGESLGIIEESLFGLENLRILKDQQGSFLVEAGYYGSEKEANLKMNELKDRYPVLSNFYIEKRQMQDIPKAISQ